MKKFLSILYSILIGMVVCVTVGLAFTLVLYYGKYVLMAVCGALVLGAAYGAGEGIRHDYLPEKWGGKPKKTGTTEDTKP